MIATNKLIKGVDQSKPGATPKAAPGLKAPSGLQKPSASTAPSSDVPATPKKPAPRASVSGPVQKSADVDEVDAIYSNDDPIKVSLAARIKAGAVAAVVPNKDAKQGKYFFNLKLNGKIPPLQKPKRDPTNIGQAAADKAEAEPAQPEKPMEDPIAKSLQLRIKEGGGQVTGVVKPKEKIEEVNFKLKLVGQGADMDLAKSNKETLQR